jgi:hypothetical protein
MSRVPCPRVLCSAQLVRRRQSAREAHLVPSGDSAEPLHADRVEGQGRPLFLTHTGEASFVLCTLWSCTLWSFNMSSSRFIMDALELVSSGLNFVQ